MLFKPTSKFLGSHYPLALEILQRRQVDPSDHGFEAPPRPMNEKQLDVAERQ